ncbi:hypothetical protein OKS68_20360 [Aeromonas veronii]|uniref:condensin complex protein MksE n=1 Tax=Aeromonas TaxID=642 RepID=UPI00226C98FA|nr:MULTISPECIES: hypothetical protein [Aeromonas]MCX9134819.1 hypothetical protein [Aeromonas veronii]MDM5064989.1 hypothetical protein [Aeromonas salmonicida]
MNAFISQLESLTALSDLFRLFNSGKHLNRVAEPALWAELEREQDSYQALFSALGFDLRIAQRGYAWFHTDEANNAVNKTSSQFALLFMCLFNTQADVGQPLSRFGDWRIDKPLIAEVYEQHQELLKAEGLDLDRFTGLLESATRLGFVLAHNGYWQLLPAVNRYLEHFESLMSMQDGIFEMQTSEGDDQPEDEEENV